MLKNQGFDLASRAAPSIINVFTVASGLLYEVSLSPQSPCHGLEN